MNFDDSSSDSFFAPSWLECCFFSSKGPLYCPQVVWILFFFLPRVHCIAPKVVNVSGSVEKCWCHFCQGFCKLNYVLVWKSFLFWNQIWYFNDHVYSSLNCWNEIREMSVFEIFFFWNSNFFFFKDPTHYSMQSFDCLVSWKQKWPVVRFKMTFSWFFVSTLNSDFGYIFWWSVMRWHFYRF